MIERNLGFKGILPDLLELGEERRRDLLTCQLDVLATIIQGIHYSSSLSLGELKRNPGIELCQRSFDSSLNPTLPFPLSLSDLQPFGQAAF